MSATIVAQLDSLRTHLTHFDLPELYSVNVIADPEEPRVSAQLAAHHPPQIVTGLLDWADTLTHLTAQAWRAPNGNSIHLSVTGRLAQGVTIRVYGGVALTQHGPGADLTPNTSTTVPLAVLRHLATSGQVIP